MRTVQNVTLLAATVTTGLIAGLFFAYANNVMPALRGADDRAFVDVMQRINVVILNPLFLSTFMGGLVISIAGRRGGGGPTTAAPCRGSSPASCSTPRCSSSPAAVNIPLNDQLAAAGDVDSIGRPRRGARPVRGDVDHLEPSSEPRSPPRARSAAWPPLSSPRLD